MLGLLVTAVFSKGAAGLALRLLAPWLPADKWARLGLAGLIGLGGLGTLTFLVGLLPGGLQWGLALPIVASVFGLLQLWSLRSDYWPIQKAEGPALLFPVGIAAFAVISMIGVLAPSTSLDWDTLAYHLAVPKIWLSTGHVEFISYIHHSNFPAAVDSLFALGLVWGGQAGAKAFCWMFLWFGIVALFGTVRARTGDEPAWWSALAFACLPVVCWESGTAYVDVAHGLFAGFGIWFGAEHIRNRDRESIILSSLLLGLAAGSKYTGFLPFGVVFLAILVSYLFGKRNTGPEWNISITWVAVAFAIASPYYVRNYINTGNPVYPFAYSVFKGKNWDEFSDRIYREEQATFGVGRDIPAAGASPLDQKIQPVRVGASILGLAYQPGRYTNPGPLGGNGFPFQAMGMVPLIALALVLAFGLPRNPARSAVAMTLVILVAWCFLSQQSRYITTIAVPLLLVAGDLTGTFHLILRAAIVIQALVTGYVMQTSLTANQLQILTGKVERPPVSFTEPAAYLNAEVKNGKVALFNEVFGFLLDIPYFWANPGHSTEIGYAKLSNGKELVASLKRLGCTHAYLNLALEPDADKVLSAIDTGEPYPAGDISDIRNKWRKLFVEAVQAGAMTELKRFGSRRIIFKIN